jgi:hypothetical protein
MEAQKTPNSQHIPEKKSNAGGFTKLNIKFYYREILPEQHGTGKKSKNKKRHINQWSRIKTQK